MSATTPSKPKCASPNSATGFISPDAADSSQGSSNSGGETLKFVSPEQEPLERPRTNFNIDDHPKSIFSSPPGLVKSNVPLVVLSDEMHTQSKIRLNGNFLELTQNTSDFIEDFSSSSILPQHSNSSGEKSDSSASKYLSTYLEYGSVISPNNTSEKIVGSSSKRPICRNLSPNLIDSVEPKTTMINPMLSRVMNSTSTPSNFKTLNSGFAAGLATVAWNEDEEELSMQMMPEIDSSLKLSCQKRNSKRLNGSKINTTPNKTRMSRNRGQEDASIFDPSQPPPPLMYQNTLQPVSNNRHFNPTSAERIAATNRPADRMSQSFGCPLNSKSGLLEQGNCSNYSSMVSRHNHLAYSPGLQYTNSFKSPEKNQIQKEITVLHVTNLDYKLRSDEWKRILTEMLHKSCKELLSLEIVTKPDKSLLGVIKLGRKEDAQMAVSVLHHKKIGYKRLNVNLAYSPMTYSPRSKIVALLRMANNQNEMPLSRFVELYEERYNQNITIAELFRLKDIVHINFNLESGVGGRTIKLLAKNYQLNMEEQMKELMQLPYCTVHSSSPVKQEAGVASQGFLPNVVVSLRGFKIAVHKLLNDHGGQMPLLSFINCYRCSILEKSEMSQADLKQYKLQIDKENGVPLEHLITCVQDVKIQYNSEKFYKYLQWDNTKDKFINSSRRYLASVDDANFNDEVENGHLVEESKRKLNQFIHEVTELLKGTHKCVVPISKFNSEFYKKYGRQCRAADYGHSKLNDLFESIPQVVQLIDGEFEKKLTLTHRAQVRRFSGDLVRLLRLHPNKQMFADEIPKFFERFFGRVLDMRDYGVCYLEDILSELPEFVVSRKEVNQRTFIQIPRVVQTDDERMCMLRLELDFIDLLKQRPRFSIRLNKFTQTFHHHFGRQCKLSNYGFEKLMDLIEAMPGCVQLAVKDGLEFIQLRPEIQMDLICQNLIKIIEENGCTLRISMQRLEDVYNSKFEPICYQEFGCGTLFDLMKMLPLESNFVSMTVLPPNELAKIFQLANSIDELEYKQKLANSNQTVNFRPDSDIEISLQVSPMNERECKRLARLALKKLIDDERLVMSRFEETRAANDCLKFVEIWKIISANNEETNWKNLNQRSISHVVNFLGEFFKYDRPHDLALSIRMSKESPVLEFSDMFTFAKQILSIFQAANKIDMDMNELEKFYIRRCAQSHQGQLVKSFPAKSLGFIDQNLLFTQGLGLLVSLRKLGDTRICFLNREFWDKNMIHTDSLRLSHGLNTSISPENLPMQMNPKPGSLMQPSLVNQTNSSRTGMPARTPNTFSLENSHGYLTDSRVARSKPLGNFNPVA